MKSTAKQLVREISEGEPDEYYPRFIAIVILALGFLLTSFSSDAQQVEKVPRIGILETGSPTTPNFEAFRQGLRDLGYVEGQNIMLEHRYLINHCQQEQAAEPGNRRFPPEPVEFLRHHVGFFLLFDPVKPAAVNHPDFFFIRGSRGFFYSAFEFNKAAIQPGEKISGAHPHDPRKNMHPAENQFCPLIEVKVHAGSGYKFAGSVLI